MAKSQDNAKVAADEDTNVVTISAEEWSEIQDRLARADQTPNLAPAIEEGPHLQDPEIREEKLAQLEEHGDKVVGLEMPDDMRELLDEAEVKG